MEDQKPDKKQKTKKKEGGASVPAPPRSEEFIPQSKLLRAKFEQQKQQGQDFLNLLEGKITITDEQLKKQRERLPPHPGQLQLTKKSSEMFRSEDQHKEVQNQKHRRPGMKADSTIQQAEVQTGTQRDEIDVQLELQAQKDRMEQEEETLPNMMEPISLPKKHKVATSSKKQAALQAQEKASVGVQDSMQDVLGRNECVIVQMPTRQMYHLNEDEVGRRDKFPAPHIQRMTEQKYLLQKIMERKIDTALGEPILRFNKNIDHYLGREAAAAKTGFLLGKMRFYSDGTSEFVPATGDARRTDGTAPNAKEDGGNVFQVVKGVNAKCLQQLICIDHAETHAVYEVGEVTEKFVVKPNIEQLYSV